MRPRSRQRPTRLGQKDYAAASKQSDSEGKDESNSKTTKDTSESPVTQGDDTPEARAGSGFETKHNITTPSGSLETGAKKPGNKPSESASNQSTNKKPGHTGSSRAARRSAATSRRRTGTEAPDTPINRILVTGPTMSWHEIRSVSMAPYCLTTDLSLALLKCRTGCSGRRR
jgi:hypothetical protein